MDLMEVQKKVVPHITELLGKKPECISSVEKNSEGWTVICDVLEKKSVPETYDLLKVFEFIVDKECRVIRFKQLRKIRRGDLD